MRKAAAFAIAVLACLAALYPVRLALGNSVAAGYGAAASISLTDGKFKSIVLQRAAAARGDVMLFGSSEFEASEGYSTHPYVFFANTNLRVNLVGRAGFHSLVHAANLGALGDSLRGKKVVFFLSPQWFTQDGIDSDTFDASSSVVQIYGFLFNPRLSEETKRAFACRFAEISAKDSHEQFGYAENFCALWAKTDAFSQAKRTALTPFYWVQYQLLLLKDGLKALRFLGTDGNAGEIKEGNTAAKDIDWGAVLQRTRAEAAAQSGNNPYGMENGAYEGLKNIAYQKGYRDSLTINPPGQSPEYGDFQLLLDVCRQEGIEPLIVSVPVNGKWYDFEGVDAGARQAYYAGVREMVRQSGFELADFSGQEYTDYFLNDPYHLGWIGWAYVDEAVARYGAENEK